MSIVKDIARGLTPPYVWKLMKKCLGVAPPESVEKIVKPKRGYLCPVCGEVVRLFKPLPLFYLEMAEKHPSVRKSISETMNVHAYSCPNCGASDRDRLYALYLTEKFGEMEKTHKSYRFLDIAPEKSLQRFIKRHDFIQYRSADIYTPDVDDKVDIMDMNIYQDGQFDVILCSHVLEHVEDDRKAMSELYRVLNPDGFAIIMVPINLLLEADFEDKSIVSEEDRWRYFGQYDHVRAYSKNGFIQKLGDAGFVVHQYDEEYFGKRVFLGHGIYPHSVLYVVTK